MANREKAYKKYKRKLKSIDGLTKLVKYWKDHASIIKEEVGKDYHRELLSKKKNLEEKLRQRKQRDRERRQRYHEERKEAYNTRHPPIDSATMHILQELNNSSEPSFPLDTNLDFGDVPWHLLQGGRIGRALRQRFRRVI